eukprot:CAMPEP_0172499966 /NCGR_PEP_ID=MMETSP1066-20121228/132973_1 /TAXON_ID=671091 /ORGANISM="Coscinodiscus wailesii, Strain CCMP2513" /LENGTH=478 /DNA_ID=CAMNT_0013273983 /DNA_START=377 /DNA_END=1813 /DNA_ORIENTATION=-
MTKKKNNTSTFRKAPQAPKRFRSAFILFSRAKRNELKTQLGPAAVLSDIAKQTAQIWHKLPPVERHYWEEMGRRDKLRYEQEKASYSGPWQISTTGRGKAQKDPTYPKRPMSAFLHFAKTERAKLKIQRPDLTFAAASSILGQRWNGASEEERKPHLDWEERERKIYNEKAAAWRETDAKRREMREQEALNTAMQNEACEREYKKNGGGGGSSGDGMARVASGVVVPTIPGMSVSGLSVGICGGGGGMSGGGYQLSPISAKASSSSAGGGGGGSTSTDDRFIGISHIDITRQAPEMSDHALSSSSGAATDNNTCPETASLQCQEEIPSLIPEETTSTTSYSVGGSRREWPPVLLPSSTYKHLSTTNCSSSTTPEPQRSSSSWYGPQPTPILITSSHAAAAAEQRNATTTGPCYVTQQQHHHASDPQCAARNIEEELRNIEPLVFDAAGAGCCDNDSHSINSMDMMNLVSNILSPMDNN